MTVEETMAAAGTEISTKLRAVADRSEANTKGLASAAEHYTQLAAQIAALDLRTDALEQGAETPTPTPQPTPTPEPAPTPAPDLGRSVIAPPVFELPHRPAANKPPTNQLKPIPDATGDLWWWGPKAYTAVPGSEIYADTDRPMYDRGMALAKWARTCADRQTNKQAVHDVLRDWFDVDVTRSVYDGNWTPTSGRMPEAMNVMTGLAIAGTDLDLTVAGAGVWSDHILGLLANKGFRNGHNARSSAITLGIACEHLRPTLARTRMGDYRAHLNNHIRGTLSAGGLNSQEDGRSRSLHYQLIELLDISLSVAMLENVDSIDMALDANTEQELAAYLTIMWPHFVDVLEQGAELGDPYVYVKAGRTFKEQGPLSNSHHVTAMQWCQVHEWAPTGSFRQQNATLTSPYKSMSPAPR